MKIFTKIIVVASFFIIGSGWPADAQQNFMVDRPGELLDLAQELATNIQTAEKVRDDILLQIKKRTVGLKQTDRKLKNTALSRGEKLELQAQKNRLEREENGYRREALNVIKGQMENIFASLGKMRWKLEKLQGQETAVHPEVVDAFNRYFKVSAQLIKNSANGLKGASQETLAMLETLEKSLIISKKSTVFLTKAIKRIKGYQKIISFYNARLTYLARGLEKHRTVLVNQRDAITVIVSLETADRFMQNLETGKMEEAIIEDFTKDPIDYFSDKNSPAQKRWTLSSPHVQKTLKRFSSGHALTSPR